MDLLNGFDPSLGVGPAFAAAFNPFASNSAKLEALEKVLKNAVIALTTGAVIGVAANKLHHIFGKAEHKLGPLVAKFGSQEAAFNAVQSATQADVTRRGLSGVFETTVSVAGHNVVVRGKVIDDVPRIGTFFTIP
jgi:hypothetical protein